MFQQVELNLPPLTRQPYTVDSPPLALPRFSICSLGIAGGGTKEVPLPHLGVVLEVL